MPERNPSSVLLADRHHGLAEGVRGLLEAAFGTLVMVGDETSLVEGAARLQPDVAVVDVSLAQGRSLGWLRGPRERCPLSKVIVLSVCDEPTVRRAALDAGADVLVLERTIVTDLLPAVDRLRGRTAAAGENEPATGSERVEKNGKGARP